MKDKPPLHKNPKAKPKGYSQRIDKPVQCNSSNHLQPFFAVENRT